ncbi:ribosomal protein L1 [Auricularia subglabra TFB-10046 SS5]|nr:ribosomal protein L1 [Auricularia subglabra TFB-10046 SS5]
MAADSLIDEHVSRAQCLKALTALHSYASKKQAERDSNELLPSREEHVWLVVGTKVMHPEKKLKPHRIPLKHPLVDPRSTSICLITKDPQREYKDKLAAQSVNFVSRVVGITKLKGKFKGFDARRALLQENGMFLADDRVIPLLPSLLGSKFFQAKKQPIPVNLTAKDLKHELERAVESTYFHQNKGTCTSVKLGPLAAPFTPAKLLDNLESALPAVVAAIKGGWDNVQNLHVKTSTSASLPIWTCELGAGEGARWDGLMEGVEEDGGKEKEKGKKRAAQADEDKDETPKAKKRKHDEAKPKDDDTTPKATPAKKSKDAAASKKAEDAPAAKKAKSDAPVSSKKSKDDAPPSSKKDKVASTPSKPASTPSKSTPSASDKPKSALKSALKPASSPAVSEKPKSALKSSSTSASEGKKEKHATFDLPEKKKKLPGAGAKKDKIVERSAGQKRREKEGRVGKDPKR